jgi:hypothetical protein
MRSMVEGAHVSTIVCVAEMIVEVDAPSTTLLRSAVPLPRYRGAG